MQGLWRYLVLMLGPGFLWGGFVCNGLWRFLDTPGEPLLMLLGLIALCGLFFAGNAGIARRYPCRCPAVSTIDWMILSAFMIIPGVIQAWNLPGPWMGAAELLIASGGAAWLLHGWPMLSGADRNFRSMGLMAALAIFGILIGMNRMHFLEAMLFWSSELLLFFLLIASPATCRGTAQKRWIQRAAIAIILLIAPFFRPDYLYAPWIKKPSCMPPEAVWIGTDILPGGSYFGWGKQNDKMSGMLFDARGRFFRLANPDGDLIPAIPGLLGIGGNREPHILLVSAQETIFAQALCESCPLVKVHCIPTPETWGGASYSNAEQFTQSCLSQATEYRPFSMLVLLAVPEYPAFEGGLQRWLNRVTAQMPKNAVAAVPARLLELPALMRYFLDHYAWHGVLPGAGEMWVFSNQPLDLTPAAIEQSLDELFGEASPLPRGVYDLMYSNCRKSEQGGVGQSPHLNAEHWHAMRTGSENRSRWFWYGLMVLLVWRLIRLFAERRGAGYRYWNLTETVFSITAGYLAWMAFLISEYYVAPVNVLIYSLIPAAFLISYCRSYFSWALLFIAAGYFIRAGYGLPGGIWLVLIAVNAWLGGCYAGKTLANPKNFRDELPAWGRGICLGAVAIGAAVWLEMSIEAVVCLLVIARLPVLWQMKLIDYKRKQEVNG